MLFHRIGHKFLERFYNHIHELFFQNAPELNDLRATIGSAVLYLGLDHVYEIGLIVGPDCSEYGATSKFTRNFNIIHASCDTAGAK